MRNNPQTLLISSDDQKKLLLQTLHDVISIIEEAFHKKQNGEILLPDKISVVFDEKTQNRINCMPGALLSDKLYIIIFLLAPFISKVYNNELYTPVLRVVSLKLPLASSNTIQHAHVSKHLEFRKFFFSTLTGTIISGVAGILAAIAGWGVWALVLQYLLNSTIDTVFLLFTVKWKPRFIFSLVSFKELMSFGFKMMISALINTTYIEMQSLVIGARYTASDLAFYKRGNQFPSLFITNICTAVGKVLFPTMSNVQDKNSIKNMTRHSMQITAYLISPLMFGLIAVSTPLVKVLLTDKWLPCVPFLQIACIQFLFQPLQAANCQAIKAMGKGGLYLKMEIAKKIVGIVLLIAAIPHGVFAIAIACAISIVIAILEHSTKIDGIGNHKAQWEEAFSCWAAVSVKSAAEKIETGVTQEVVSLEFTVRQTPDTRRINATTNKIRFQGLEYNIDGVQPNYKSLDYMKITAGTRKVGEQYDFD